MPSSVVRIPIQGLPKGQSFLDRYEPKGDTSDPGSEERHWSYRPGTWRRIYGRNLRSGELFSARPAASTAVADYLLFIRGTV